MNNFSPFEWVLATLTVWHAAIWVAFLALSLWLKPKDEPPMPVLLRLWAGLCVPIVLYCMVAIIIGQLFGDRFAWSQLWPSGLANGALLSTFILPVLVPAIWNERGQRLELIILGILGIPLGTAFFGLFFSGVWWLFPRIIGFGFIDFPKHAWAVQV